MRAVPSILDDVFPELRKLNEAVPSHRRLPTESDVTAVERRTGIPNNADLRRYLLEVSDVVLGVKEPVTIEGRYTDFDDRRISMS